MTQIKSLKNGKRTLYPKKNSDRNTVKYVFGNNALFNFFYLIIKAIMLTSYVWLKDIYSL